MKTPFRTATAKQKRIALAIRENPELSDRQIGEMTGATHPTVAAVRKSWGEWRRERIGSDGIPRRVPLPRKIDRQRFERELKEAAEDLERVLHGISLAYRTGKRTDKAFAEVVSSFRNPLAARFDDAENAIRGA